MFENEENLFFYFVREKFANKVLQIQTHTSSSIRGTIDFQFEHD